MNEKGKEHEKIFKVLLCVICGLCMFSTTVMAQDGPSDGSGVELDPETRYFDYGAIGADNSYPIVTNSGSKPATIPSVWAAVTEQAWANYGIQQYWQEDWTTPICGETGTGTVARYGCTVTSYSMVASKYGVYKNPEEMFDLLVQYGAANRNDCKMTWNKTANENALGLTFEHWNNTKHGNYTEAGGFLDIEGALKTGKPVIVGLHKVEDSSTHYVVCYGYEKYSDGGKFHYIFNPSRTPGKTTIEEYMAKWYIKDFTLLYN